MTPAVRAKDAGEPIAAAAAAGIVALAFALTWSQPGFADESLRCAGTNVSVSGVDRAENESACQGVVAAVEFLTSVGLDASAPAEIRLVEALPEIQQGARAYGCKVKADNRIYMLNLSECRKLPLAADVPVDAAVHRGLVAHEVGHHIAAANFNVARPTIVAHEYIAYVTMFAALEPSARERLLARFPGEGFESAREIGLTVYLLGPNRFGAEAYRHFKRPGNGAPFVEQILSGHALATEDPP
jgi:hypothetical protein